jgi:DNA-directed RNA polymerase specialized sigma24 family protein
MTPEETRNYLKSYRNMRNRVEYINNKMINVKSIRYDDSPSGSYSEPKTQNDYIMMKDKYLKEMSSIRASVESIEDMTLRDVLFYRYIECLEIYDIANIMDCSNTSVFAYLRDAIKELSIILD